MTGQAIAAAGTRRLSLARRGSVEPWAVRISGFALIVYLGMRGGGFDPVVRGEIGVLVWWALLMGALCGVVATRRLPPAAWATIALLGAFALLTGLSASWSESQERTFAELAKVATYLGFLLVAVMIGARGRGRELTEGIAAAIALIGLVAVLSRLHPAWFPAQALPELLPTTARRLAYPLNYWNALAALMAVGLPLLLHQATTARRIALQGIAAGAIPVVTLCCWLTVSRGGAVAAVIAVVVFVALAPNRAALLLTTVVAAAGSALLIVAADARPAVQAGAQAVGRQGDTMIVLVVIVGLGVALVRVAAALVERYVERPAWADVRLRGDIPRRMIGVAVTAILLAAAVAVGAPAAQDRWEQFKQPPPAQHLSTTDTVSRFATVNGNHRYQLWQSAVDAYETRPWGGIGAGTFEFWWARNATAPAFVRSAHSLYIETLAELGRVGFVLLLALFVGILAIGLRWSVATRTDRRQRELAAAATAAILAFAISAALEWTWEIAVLPACVLALGGVLVTLGPTGVPAPTASRPLVPRAGLTALALAALVAVAIPLAGESTLRDSQRLVARGELAKAFDAAMTSREVQPYAGTPRLQEALIAERAGDLVTARRAALAATEREPTNWRTWYVLARVQAARGEPRAALRSYEHARGLNPRSGIFPRT